MRLVQAAFWEYGRCPLRLNTYVDDPLAMVRGTHSERRHHITILVLLWRALGLPLAFKKGLLGRSVGWIGLFLEVKEHSVDVTISAEGGRASVVVTDNGRGFDPAAVGARSFGLRLLGDLVRDAGGTLEVETAPGQGATLRAEVPYR